MSVAKPIIFLSYAREDRRRVLNIYRALRNAGLNPWMDQPPKPWHNEGILPGQQWDSEIRKKISQAALVLLFLSGKSLAKQGYVQREYRLALNLALERPPASVSVVPILLESCDVPDIRVDTISLRHFQWHPQYRSTIDELVSLVTNILAPTPIEFPRPDDGTDQTSDARALFAIVGFSESVDDSMAGALTNCVAALLRGDVQAAIRASWSAKASHTDLNLENVTHALLQISDPAIATGCALVVAQLYNRRDIAASERSRFQAWLTHRVLEVGAIGAMLLTQTKRPGREAYDSLQAYAAQPNRLRGAQLLFRDFITPDSSVARLTERAPLLMWQVLANDPHLAGMEMRHLSFHDASSRFQKLVRAKDWRTREIAGAIWAADDRVPISKKLTLFEDPEPRVRFRALEGMLHARQYNGDFELIMNALLANTHTESETRSYRVHGVNDNRCVMVALEDSAFEAPSPSFWGGGLGYDFVESLDTINLRLCAFTVLGEFYEVAHPSSWHYAEGVPQWIRDSQLARSISG